MLLAQLIRAQAATVSIAPPHQQQVVSWHGVPGMQLNAGKGGLRANIFKLAKSPSRTTLLQALVKL